MGRILGLDIARAAADSCVCVQASEVSSTRETRAPRFCRRYLSSLGLWSHYLSVDGLTHCALCAGGLGPVRTCGAWGLGLQGTSYNLKAVHVHVALCRSRAVRLRANISEMYRVQ